MMQRDLYKLFANPTGETISQALLLKGDEQQELFRIAREKRVEHFPHNTVEVRSVIEVSNICAQSCCYCGMNIHSERERYIIDHDELMDITARLYAHGRRFLLLQSGENRSQSYIDAVCRFISGVKAAFSELTVILCLGNLGLNSFRQLKDAGADRYILKFETSNSVLYEEIKPGDSLKARVEGIEQLVGLGFEVGTGNIIGLPGQQLNDLVSDLFFFSRFSLSMTSCSVFVPGLGTALQSMPTGDIDLTLNFMALLRIIYPHTRIPTTSSLEKGRADGQFLGLMAGANTVTIHEGTPEKHRNNYPIYSADRFMPDEEKIRRIVSRAALQF